jgi:putative ubiquitin-RnfH superfamily antitoxin RatB of RatAB toxin-antitoxin module
MAVADANLPAAPALMIAVQVVYCPRPGSTDSVDLQLPLGSTLHQALQASGLLQRHALIEDGLRFGVWSKVREGHTLLRERDRVEIYRPLTVDPKEARRLRYKRHRLNKAGVGKAVTAHDSKDAPAPLSTAV